MFTIWTVTYFLSPQVPSFYHKIWFNKKCICLHNSRNRTCDSVSAQVNLVQCGSLLCITILIAEINGPEDEIWLRKPVNPFIRPVLPLGAKRRTFYFYKNLLHLLPRLVVVPVWWCVAVLRRRLVFSVVLCSVTETLPEMDIRVNSQQVFIWGWLYLQRRGSSFSNLTCITCSFLKYFKPSFPLIFKIVA